MLFLNIKCVSFISFYYSLGSLAFGSSSTLRCVNWIGPVITLPTDIFLNSPNAMPCVSIDGTFIDTNAYYGNGFIVSATIPSIITNIGLQFIHAYYYLLHIPQIILGDSAFSACSALSDVVFINGLTMIGTYMFLMNAGIISYSPTSTALKTITIPSTITIVGKLIIPSRYSFTIFIFTVF